MDFVLLAKIRLLFGLFVGLSACGLRFLARGQSMTNAKDFLIDIGILVGSLAIVSLGAFLMKLLQAPVKLYNEKIKSLMDAERVIGPPKSVTRDAVMVCAQIRDFVHDFIGKHGPVPEMTLFTDPQQRLQREKEQAAWGYKFAAAFRADLRPSIETVLSHLQAEGQRDIRANSLLEQAPLYPDFALELTAIIFKMALRLTLIEKAKEV